MDPDPNKKLEGLDLYGHFWDPGSGSAENLCGSETLFNMNQSCEAGGDLVWTGTRAENGRSSRLRRSAALNNSFVIKCIIH